MSKYAPRKQRSDGGGLFLLLAIIMIAYAFGFCGCAGVPPGAEGSNNCGVTLAGDLDDRFYTSELTKADLAERIEMALDASTKATDPRLFDIATNCSAMVGYRVYTKKTRSWPDPYNRGFNVAGLTWCDRKVIVIGTPEGANWSVSSLVHELFHVMQNCEPPQPPDIGEDTMHADWFRHGIYKAIEETYNAYPETKR